MGVLQGSVLGSVLLALFINDIFPFVEKFSFLMYGDDLCSLVSCEGYERMQVSDETFLKNLSVIFSQKNLFLDQTQENP